MNSFIDVSRPKERPKYLGRVTATFGIGFILGPAISALLPNFSSRNKIKCAALLPLFGFIIALLFFKETRIKPDNVLQTTLLPTTSDLNPNLVSSQNTSNSISKRRNNTSNINDLKGAILALPVVLLVLNGFLIMYAFATETIYAMFLKDSFGYGERTLSTLFAINGLFIGIFQVFLIKPMVNVFGKHVTLIIGNLMLALGMIGVALIRRESIHFILFTVHIV